VQHDIIEKTAAGRRDDDNDRLNKLTRYVTSLLIHRFCLREASCEAKLQPFYLRNNSVKPRAVLIIFRYADN